MGKKKWKKKVKRLQWEILHKNELAQRKANMSTIAEVDENMRRILEVMSHSRNLGEKFINHFKDLTKNA